jgi:DNA repair protein RecO (recombination protein O)
VERLKDRGIVIKSVAYQERDTIVTLLTEANGKISGIAKNSVHSKRYGGSLGLLSCSSFVFFRKPGAELLTIIEAKNIADFTTLSHSMEKFACASVGAELCLRTLEGDSPIREVFSLMSNFLYFLDKTDHVLPVLNSFLVKLAALLGYPPTLTRCLSCSKDAATILTARSYWSAEGGGLVCSNCARDHLPQVLQFPILTDSLHHLQIVSQQSFKSLFSEPKADVDTGSDQAYTAIRDFANAHLPNLPKEGLKSLNVLESFLQRSV